MHETGLDGKGLEVSATTHTNVLSGVPYLAARVARLALQLDELALELANEPLTVADTLLLDAPAAHLRLAVDGILEALQRADQLDQRPQLREAA